MVKNDYGVNIFFKPCNVSADEEFKAQHEKFEWEYVTLEAEPVTAGRQRCRQSGEPPVTGDWSFIILVRVGVHVCCVLLVLFYRTSATRPMRQG